ncbi:hypothetical protein Mapa_001144 [Marchantia paleacea]|nr:hypothetical protein Mapa_001144 [Marchantia paleacea]
MSLHTTAVWALARDRPQANRSSCFSLTPPVRESSACTERDKSYSYHGLIAEGPELSRANERADGCCDLATQSWLHAHKTTEYTRSTLVSGILQLSEAQTKCTGSGVDGWIVTTRLPALGVGIHRYGHQGSSGDLSVSQDRPLHLVKKTGLLSACIQAKQGRQLADWGEDWARNIPEQFDFSSCLPGCAESWLRKAMAVSGAACLANSALSSSEVPVQISAGSLRINGRSSDFPQFAENSLSSSRGLGQPRRKLNVVRHGYGYQHVVLAAGSDSDKKPWDFGRFIRTYTFYNEPFNLAKVFEFVSARLSGSSEEKPSSGMEKEAVLVTGATGGTGKRVVTFLQSKGIPVRALVRNVEKARSLLGPDVELVVADITQKATLLPEYFKGVRQVINCVSVIVGPKEGDTAERQKYMQIKGDSPETVELKGVQNLIEAVKENVGVRDGVILYTVTEKGPAGPAWGSLDDVVMGGVSESSMQVSLNGGENGGPVGLFKGIVSTSNNGGFASIRTKNFSPVQNLSAYEGIEMRIKGNGRRFKLIIRLSADWDAIGYTLSFDTAYNEWQTIRLPFKDFIPVFRAKSVKDAPPFDPSQITSLQLLYSKFEYDGALNPSFETGAFELPIASIKSYMKEPIKPRFVHVGSAGVTRPDRPGLDLSKQPPAVRLNKELDYILTYKLKGEDAIRDSGIPYAIIRPCALTEEPAGAELIFEQGDNITGKVGREEIARICIAALDSPAATDTTFEVKSTVPFSQPFEIDPSNPPPERDYAEFFATLKTGITGKEALEQQEPVPV